MDFLAVLRIICLIACLDQIAQHCEGRSVPPKEKESELWVPPNGQDRTEWLKYHGFPKEKWERTQKNMKTIKKLMRKLLKAAENDNTNATSPSEIDDSLDGCTWVTEEQTDKMIIQLEMQTGEPGSKKTTLAPSTSRPHLFPPPPRRNRPRSQNRRRNHRGRPRYKRKLEDFTKNVFGKWDVSRPIGYIFDGRHTPEQQERIRSGIRQLEANTCVRFQELPRGYSTTDNHILVTAEPTGCHSYIGRIHTSPQQLNLQAECLLELGTVMHEFFHALGVWHEQSRYDRDLAIRVNTESLGVWISQFIKQYTISHGVDYDFNSVMHYGAKAGSINGQDTMTALNPVYQHNMGQRSVLSFLDAKAINIEYCSDKCNVELPFPCERGGYQDPNNCYQCKCPPGWTGTYCQVTEKHKNGHCKGENEMSISTTPVVISTPDYDYQRSYVNKLECNWRFTAPYGHRVVLKFEGAFGIYCGYSQHCLHWVEIKVNKAHEKPGGRYCCYETPRDEVRSEEDEMLVMFRAHQEMDPSYYLRGFQAKVWAEPIPGVQNTPPPTPPTTPPTTPSPSPPSTVTSTVNPTTSTSPPTTTSTTATTTTTTTEAPMKPTGTNFLDMAIVLDSSESITSENWPKVLTFAKNMVGELMLGDQKDRCGIVTFGTQASLNIRLSDYFDADNLKAAINSRDIPFRDGMTNIAGGLRLTHGQFFAPGYGERDWASDVMILVLDGMANMETEDTLREAMAARDAGIQIFVIGVGQQLSYQELFAIAGDSRMVFQVQDFDDLERDIVAPYVMNIISAINMREGATKPSTSTTMVPPSVYTWECDFEWDMCDFQQDTYDEFEWTRTKDATPSKNTGPDFAQKGNYYIFIEASPQEEKDEALIFLPHLKNQGQHCVSFWYHMFGKGMGIFEIFKITRYDWFSELIIRGDQGNSWKYAELDFSADIGNQLAFSGVVGANYTSDIAIDNISIKEGHC